MGRVGARLNFRLMIFIKDYLVQTFNVSYFQVKPTTFSLPLTPSLFSLSLFFSHKSKMSGWPPPGPGPWAGLQGPPYSWDSMNSSREGRDPLTKYVASPLLEDSTENRPVEMKWTKVADRLNTGMQDI